MSQITLYLDDATQALVDEAAQSSGLSKSRWVAELIRKNARKQWPKAFLGAAGSIPDFPLLEGDGSQTLPADVPRIGP